MTKGIHSHSYDLPKLELGQINQGFEGGEVTEISLGNETSSQVHPNGLEKSPDAETDDGDRETWDNPIEFLLSCISMSVGLGNIWRFPFTAYENGGGAFLIPYLVVLFFIGKPLYFLEMAIGQFSSYGQVKVWKLSPIFKGVGYGSMIGTACVVSYYCSLMAVIVFYFCVSFRGVLPWAECDPSWGGDLCDDGTLRPVTNKTLTELYYENEVFPQYQNLDNGIGVPEWRLSLCLLCSWILIFLSLVKGVKSSGKVAYFTALFPYVVMFILLGRGVTLDGSWAGIKFFLTPDWGKIIEPNVWYAAVGQCFFSLSTGFGPIIMFSSYNPFKHNVYKDAFIISLMDTFTSLLAGLTIFAILGSLATESGKEVSQVVNSGPGLAFVSYPEAIAKFDFCPQVQTRSKMNQDETTSLLRRGTSGTRHTIDIEGTGHSSRQFRNGSMGSGRLSDVGVASYESISTVPTTPDSLERTSKVTKVQPGNLKLLSSKFESLDYDLCENALLIDEERTKGFNFIYKKDLYRWIIMVFIGVFTALIACAIDIAIEELSSLKYSALKNLTDQCVLDNCLVYPLMAWIGFNVIPVLIGAVLVAYVEPVAAGSGIPQVKCYLNGVKIPRIVRIKTLIIKAFGVTCSVVGGLAVGKEGPMIHSGAVVAAGLSQGKSTSFRKDFKIFQYFREDHEKRDFVSAGAAAGVAAAFGAPVGGVLFSLEEGASFWNQSLTWRIFFCSMISTFTLNVVLSAYHGRPGELTYAGLLNFGKFDNTSYDFIELPVFLVMGAVGGLLGALFNHANYKLTVFRMRNIYRSWAKVLEAIVVAACTATVGFAMIVYLDDCKPLGDDPTRFPIQMYCGDGQYSALGAIWFQTPEASVRSLFHDIPGSHKFTSIFVFFAFYFMLSCWTYGLSVSSGLFIPSLLVGAAWGRLVGTGMEYLFPDQEWVDPGKYAFFGAAAQLGGVVRMTISLTVILIEATGNLTLGLPLMLILIVAKWTGDLFNEGIYDTHIRLMGVPILPWSPPPLSHNIYATEVMSCPVVTFNATETVANIIRILTHESHNGFPVVDQPTSNERRNYGTFRGLILRSQLIVMLQHKLFNETAESWSHRGDILKYFRDAYPRYPTIQQVHISEEESNFTVDLRPVMNPASYTALHNASMPRIFRLFRGLGLRHLVIVNDVNEVVGIVTRKDLARYRVETHMGKMHLEELTVFDR